MLASGRAGSALAGAMKRIRPSRALGAARDSERWGDRSPRVPRVVAGDVRDSFGRVQVAVEGNTGRLTPLAACIVLIQRVLPG